ncbi:DoxX family protein, partial [Mesorhizobium sp. M2C.T.Ca.TU.009.01.2.1]
MSATTDRANLIIPALGRLYSALHDAGETLLRAVAGGFLAIHGSQ